MGLFVASYRSQGSTQAFYFSSSFFPGLYVYLLKYSNDKNQLAQE